jgi:hypothetical protein
MRGSRDEGCLSEGELEWQAADFFSREPTVDRSSPIEFMLERFPGAHLHEHDVGIRWGRTRGPRPKYKDDSERKAARAARMKERRARKKEERQAAEAVAA